jgi:hypothetical protein
MSNYWDDYLARRPWALGGNRAIEFDRALAANGILLPKPKSPDLSLSTVKQPKPARPVRELTKLDLTMPLAVWLIATVALHRQLGFWTSKLIAHGSLGVS